MKTIFNFDKDLLEYLDETKASELIEAGDAVEIVLSDYDYYKAQADRLHEDFQSAVDAIRSSDNPMHTDEYKEYEIEKLEKVYEEESAEVEEKYVSWREANIDLRQRAAAQEIVEVSDDDRQLAEQFANRAKLAILSEGEDAIVSIGTDIRRLTDGQKTALQAHIPNLLGGADVTPVFKRDIISAVQPEREAHIAAKIAEQMPHSVLGAKRRSEIAREVARRPGVLDGDQMSKETYDILRGDDEN